MNTMKERPVISTIDTPEQLQRWMAENPVPPGGVLGGTNEWKALVLETFSVRHTTMLLDLLRNPRDETSIIALLVLRSLGWQAHLMGFGSGCYYELVKPDGSTLIVHPPR